MRRSLVPATVLLIALAGCGAGTDEESAGSPTSTAATTAEEINPCSPEADPEEVALEGSAAPAGATIHDIRGVEYRFDGVPTDLPAGPHGFRLVGAGAELHELALVRINDDRPLSELIELPEEEQEKAIPYVGGVTACPGTTSAEAVGGDLEPGRYGLLCFIPIGTTPELSGADLAAAYENAPHFTEGMLAEFTVTPR